MGFPWDYSAAMGVPQDSRGYPMGLPWVVSHGSRTGLPWASHETVVLVRDFLVKTPMGLSWDSLGTPLGSNHFHYFVVPSSHETPMDSHDTPKGSRGTPMGLLLDSDEMPMKGFPKTHT